MKYCQDYSGAPPCCLSCHEDADDNYPDYPLCEIVEDGVVVAEVCCAVAEYARNRPANTPAVPRSRAPLLY